MSDRHWKGIFVALFIQCVLKPLFEQPKTTKYFLQHCLSERMTFVLYGLCLEITPLKWHFNCILFFQASLSISSVTGILFSYLILLSQSSFFITNSAQLLQALFDKSSFIYLFKTLILPLSFLLSFWVKMCICVCICVCMCTCFCICT